MDSRSNGRHDVSNMVEAEPHAPGPLVSAANVINNGTGFGTYYYDIKQTKACGADFSLMNQGNVECNRGALSLNKINSNNLVAMNHTLLAGNLAKYCGKRVVVTVNGVKSNVPFFIGDGCERCGTGSSNNHQWNPTGAPGLDFSYSQLSALNNNACFAGHIDLSWEITDETVFNFDTNAPGKPQGPANQKRRSTRSERLAHMQAHKQ
ncbi:hypothetical protein PT974_05748 [Cladobotryum mycophilum]|uniref:Chitinase n=1 Tax=Cladobotryum mycophilum TaxID=491253 RepID=A0ABR0SJW3_9HYPO